MKLIATPLSHYARKSRVLLDLYGLPYTFVDIGPIAEVHLPGEAGNNPMMRVPVLEHGSDWLIESDHISSFLVRQYDPQDKYKVNSHTVFDLNARAMMNGIMAEEVKVIVARRMQVPTESYKYFGKAHNAIEHGLTWLNAHHAQFDAVNPTYRDFHLVCCWDHLEYYDFVPNMTGKFKHLHEIVSRVSENEIVRQTAPTVLKPK